jgi:catechol 2,3-dioxygenase-like lactoylglutathione lyase family enzyme
MPTPSLNGIIETCLYVEELPRAVEFYQHVLGCKIMHHDDRFCALSVADTHVLLLFKRGATLDPIHLPGGIIPPHDGHGPEHIGFAIAANTLDDWRSQLTDARVTIESTVTWPRGGTSLYFRDPDNHLVELLTPGIWPIY